MRKVRLAFSAFQDYFRLPLVMLLMLALAARLPWMSGIAHEHDSRHFAAWISAIDQYGVWNFYHPYLRMGIGDRTYPPLSTLSFDAVLLVNGFAPDPRFALDNPAFVTLLKVFPVICEIALVAVIYLWLRDRSTRLRWLISGALALAPGLIATSSWWGQYEAPFTLFLVLALIALNRDRPITAWLMFAIAALLKQPAAVLAPILLVVTFRRYGWRKTAYGIAGTAAIFILATLPFALSTGIESALSPYLQAGDAFPFLSNNAYNLWFALVTLKQGAMMVFHQDANSDALFAVGGLTYKLMGLLLFGGYTLWIMLVSGRQASERREFVWSAALFLGFFILPTQVHERYLYPSVVLLLIAIAQDRRLVYAAFAAVVTYSYNIFAITITDMRKIPLISPENIAGTVALMNVGLLVLVARWTWKTRRGAVTVTAP